MAAEAIRSGGRLGPYELLSPIGAGGMGEVWKARDTRVDRVVAIKFSQAEFSERFEREARAIAALNHPNICHLYDVGPNYLVMEYVEGSPVSPPDNVRKLLDIAVQIADGLATAHAVGIVHRDLKPDNVLITRDGRVKILDFGLAKQVTAAPDEATIAMTNPGTIMGTVAYMSPEQARGQELDARSDQFSFGLMLYELATGKRAFQRDSAAETMAAIIREEPVPLPASLPSPLRWSIERCLAKEPSNRYDTTRGLYLELRTIRDRLSEATGPTAVKPSPAGTRWAVIVLPLLGAAIVGAAIVLSLWARQPWHPNLAGYRFTPFATEDYGEYGGVWSPDGRSIAYFAKTQSELRVMVKSSDGNSPFVLARHSLANLSGARLAAADGTSVSWSADGSRVFYVWFFQPWSVARMGGLPQAMQLGPARTTYVLASSPDGSAIAMVRDTEIDGKRTRRLWLSSPPGAAPVMIPYVMDSYVNTPDGLSWAPDSTRLLVTETRGTGRRLVLVHRNGAARPLIEIAGLRWMQHSWLPDNRHAVLATSPSDQGIRIIDTSSGEITNILPSSTLITSPSVSPDGKRIAYTEGLRRTILMEIPLDGSQPRTFLSSRVDQADLAWATGGEEFVYIYGDELRVRNRTGSFERVVVSHRDFPGSQGLLRFEKPTFSPDAQRIAYSLFGMRGNTLGIWISPASGGAPALVEKASGYAPMWSPDGASILFAGNGGLQRYRLGSNESPVTIYPGQCDPSWSPDGKWIRCQAGTLVSPDGKDVRIVSRERLSAAAWSRDSTAIYAIRQTDKQELVRMEIATGRVRVISVLPPDFEIVSAGGGPTRLALSPDEKSVITNVRRNEGDIWILDGFEPPRSFWERLWPLRR